MSIFVKTEIMRFCIKHIPVLLSLMILVSCGTARMSKTPGLPSGSIPSQADEYLRKYSALAIKEMNRTGIPASITLAQGMLESDYGRSKLARKGNNHFGIKCHSDWRGEKIYHDDNRRGECFRAYRTVEDSYRDHSDFLVKGSRYRELFRLSSTDYRGWAHGLKKAGYATDPKYPALLIRKIEDYGLHSFDTGDKTGLLPVKQPAVINIRTDSVAGPAQIQQQVSVKLSEQDTAPVITPAPVKTVTMGTVKLEMNNNVQYIIVRENDTYKSLAEEYMLLSWEIVRYNDLASGTPLKPGQVLYLQPKRNKAEAGFNLHTVLPGETMYSVSQKYAVRLSALYKMNLMEEGTECATGQKLRLR